MKASKRMPDSFCRLVGWDSELGFWSLLHTQLVLISATKWYDSQALPPATVGRFGKKPAVHEKVVLEGADAQHHVFGF